MPLVAVSLALAGCASSTKKLSAAYVSPSQYANLDCAQLGEESARLRARYVEVGASVDKAAANDAGITAVGAVLFWPALFFLGGNQQQEAEYSRLKGEYDAVSQTASLKKCTPTLETNASEPEPAKAENTVARMRIEPQ